MAITSALFTSLSFHDYTYDTHIISDSNHDSAIYRGRQVAKIDSGMSLGRRITTCSNLLKKCEETRNLRITHSIRR
ncbi:hypothetical protein FEK42_14390 [Escherichia sp. E2748]|nr:hypothetical protein D9734_08005 [Escherichia sp. E14S1]TBR67816.1 hypothetical protein D9737_09640 [Escherichia sp. E10V4]TGB89725.1 hypothetical protein CRI64_21725 [Escherichia sp. E2748]TGB97005.1 hypothetical protein CRG94_01320 [Escherichia sp. E3356]TGB99837.1 hypothetical protein CRG92_14615 [Escherichia sp. E2586]TGC14034.1 hypothetical protein CQJ28_20985 [Escherichia sp. E2562]TGC21837.1 hypothetical protein CQJ27_23075 [Escherichia sp. E1130]